MDLPKRKQHRLPAYNYSTANAYFFTVCTEGRKNLFWTHVGATVINQMKGAISKSVGFPVWQKGFYDHVICGEADYRETWQYIVGNPGKWAEDNLYIHENF